jgi:NTE family protein
MLREEGRRAADEFLRLHGNDLGRRSTVDIDALLAEC